MIVYFADRSMNVIGQAGTFLKRGLIISGDSLEDSVENGAKTLTFDLNYTAGNHAKAKDLCIPGNYAFCGSRKAVAYTIVDTEDDSDLRQINVYCEDAGLDMISGFTGETSGSATLATFASAILSGTGFEIGVNEITESKTLKWENDATIVERLLDLATQFGAEMNYSYTFDGMKVTHRYVNFYKKRGQARNVTLRLGKEVTKIIEKKTIENLATALVPSGDNDITLSQKSYDDGDIYLADGILYSRTAKQKWQKGKTGDIVRAYTDESTDTDMLLSNAVEALKTAREIETTYEIEVQNYQKPIDAGDTVNIVDAEGKLYLQSRVQKISTSESDGTKELELGKTVELKKTEAEQRVTTGGTTGGISSPDSFTTYGASGTATALSTTDTAVTNTLTDSNDYYGKTGTGITLKIAGRYMVSVNGDYTGTGNVTVKVLKGTSTLKASTSYINGSGSVSFTFIDTFSAGDVLSVTEACGASQTISDNGNTVAYIQRLG